MTAYVLNFIFFQHMTTPFPSNIKEAAPTEAYKFPSTRRTLTPTTRAQTLTAAEKATLAG